ncbi:GNAT family N-acetyltransferase [Microbulbifer sp. SAOS-129_SWC]|uniref:GNAT family N-acetyltransferase n=1 Tax=Microbulbifer sp. SAOS-129_SWC TaxID=3145235 RepID=UPI00321700CA
MLIRQPHQRDAAALARFYTSNAGHLQPWEPLRPEGYHSVSAWEARLREREREQAEGRAAYFAGFDPHTGATIGVCSLTNIVRGAFQACHMGYAVDLSYQGQGWMKAICLHAIHYAFEELRLHRIMANYIPRNERSGQLLQTLGFEQEGLASKYLLINGRWEDHVLTSLLNPNSSH